MAPRCSSRPILPAEVVGPAQHGLHLSGEHVQIKGLGHKIVPAHVDRHDDIHVVRSGGEKENGHLGDPADFGAPVVAVVKGQDDVQNDQLRVKSHEFGHHVLKIGRAAGFPAPRADVALDGPTRSPGHPPQSKSDRTPQTFPFRFRTIWFPLFSRTKGRPRRAPSARCNPRRIPPSPPGCRIHTAPPPRRCRSAWHR